MTGMRVKCVGHIVGPRVGLLGVGQGVWGCKWAYWGVKCGVMRRCSVWRVQGALCGVHGDFDGVRCEVWFGMCEEARCGVCCGVWHYVTCGAVWV